VKVQGANDFESAFTAITRERVEALIVYPDPLFGQHEPRIVEFVCRWDDLSQS